MPLSDRVGRIFTPTLQSAAQAGVLGVSSRVKPGTNVFARDWDLLIVLDTCRCDALEAVAPEYAFLPDTIPSVWSVGSSTMEWTGNTFVEPYRDVIESTAVISANPSVFHGLRDGDFQIHAPRVRQATDWGMVDETTPYLLDAVWQYAPVDPWAGLPLPDYTTDRAIAIGRSERPPRCLVHYLPPHEPYRATALTDNRPLTTTEADPWRAIQDGVSRDRVWRAYLDELRWVLDQVTTLLENYDAERAIITADHGELFGEWGLYSHSGGVPHWHLRRVPWVETTATDTDTYEPTVVGNGDHRTVSNRATRHLERLGYL